MYIEPEEGYQRSCNNETKSRKNKESHTIGDKTICYILKKKESPGKTIEAICDVYTIGTRIEYEYKEWDIEVSEFDYPDKWNMNTRISEFSIEPPCTDESEHDEEYRLYSHRESLGLSYPTDIEVVIYESYSTDTDKCKYYYVCLITIPETIMYACPKDFHHPWFHK